MAPRKPSTSWRRICAWSDRRSEDDSTSPAAAPFAVRPPDTSCRLSAASWVRTAACCTLPDISCIAALCCSTAAEMDEAISSTPCTVREISWIAPSAERVSAWIAVICERMSSVAFAVWLARLFTSPATTAKPLPASPARAASIVAFKASRLVCAAMSWISCTTSPTFCAASASPATEALVRRPSSAAWRAIEEACATCRLISAPVAAISSTAAATP